jgi:hypothetical protein
LLIEAKAKVEHGDWLPWVEANLDFGERQAEKYARLASGWVQLPDQIRTGCSHLNIGLHGALKLLAKPKPNT